MYIDKKVKKNKEYRKKEKFKREWGKWKGYAGHAMAKSIARKKLYWLVEEALRVQ